MSKLKEALDNAQHNQGHSLGNSLITAEINIIEREPVGGQQTGYNAERTLWDKVRINPVFASIVVVFAIVTGSLSSILMASLIFH